MPGQSRRVKDHYCSYGNVATKSTWVIDESHSQAGFGVRHLMISTVKGRFLQFGGEIVIDEVNPENSTVNVTIDAASISTNDEKRDAHLRSADFLDVENHPTLTFKSRSVGPVNNGRFVVQGDLTVRGVTRPVTIEAEQSGRTMSPWGYEVIAFEGKTSVNRKDFGLNWNATMESGGVLVGEDVRLRPRLRGDSPVSSGRTVDRPNRRGFQPWRFIASEPGS